MFAKHRQLFLTAIFFMDAGILFGSWVGAYALRFHVLPVAAPLGVPPLDAYLGYGLVVTLAALLVLRSLRIYRSARTARLSREIVTIAEGVLLTGALAGLGSFFVRAELARSVIILFAALAGTGLVGTRLALRAALRTLRRTGRNLRHVLIVGTGPLARDVARKMRAHPDFGFAIEGMVAAAAAYPSEIDGISVLGPVSELSALVERTGAAIVYLALQREESEAELRALEGLSNSTAAVRLVPDLARAFTLNASVEDFDGTPVVLVTESPDQGWNLVSKRLFDLIVSAVALIVLSPVFLLIAIWIRLDSRGAVFFAQERVGLSGRRFRMLKFRTMHSDSESRGPQWTRANDPRRTRAGAFLRRTSLDELPQLWNVLVGDMSLVGPRPEQPAFVDQFRGRIPRYMLRHHVKAGITGWAQVNGLRGDTPLDQRIEYDLHYIQNWSMAFDLKILFLTLFRVVRDASAH